MFLWIKTRKRGVKLYFDKTYFGNRTRENKFDKKPNDIRTEEIISAPIWDF